MSWTKENMPSFTPDIEGRPTEGLWTPTVDQKHRLGARYQDGLGRVYRYVKNGSTEIAGASMTTAEATHADVTDIVQTGYTTAVGDERIRVLVTTTNGILDDELVDGQMLVAIGASNLGQYAYGIAGNKYISGDTVMDIQLYEPIRVATTAAETFTFNKNPHRDVIVCATTPTGVLTGVTTCVLPASYYGWVQTKGPCAVIVDTSETVVVGCLVGHAASTAVAGACGVAHIAESIWGHCMQVEAAASSALINLNLE
jgi:hypothetical protein